MLLSVFGPGQAAGESLEEFHLRQIRHTVWQMSHGVWWRAQHDCLNQLDLAKLADLALADGDLDDVDLTEHQTERLAEAALDKKQLLAPYTPRLSRAVPAGLVATRRGRQRAVRVLRRGVRALQS
jgi:hypothetical protein